MVNPNRLIKITKAESKDFLDKAQDIIKKDILGPKFKGDKLLRIWLIQSTKAER